MTNPTSTETSHGAGLDEASVVAVLKRTTPFGPLPREQLEKLARSARVVDFKKGDVIYSQGDPASDLFVVVSGRIEHSLGPGSHATNLVKFVGPGEIVGWAALLKNYNQRLASTTCREDCQVLRINGKQLLQILGEDPDSGETAMGLFAKMVQQDFTVPTWVGQVLEVPKRVDGGYATSQLTGFALTSYRISKWLKSPRPYLMLVGFTLLFGSWWLASDVLHWWRFQYLPGPTEVLTEWFSHDPIYGTSLYTPNYYVDIWTSLRRILEAFAIATALGVPYGLFLGWSKAVREYTFPIFETIRPIPILAWIPLAIVMFTGTETPVIFLTTLASFYATALNTMLGVESIDESYVRAASCLGASRWQIFRQVIVPGSLPYMFTGLQISIGVAWFSLVAGEMVSGQYGLGYMIMTSYTMVRYPTIIIGMVTLGIVGYVTSALVRIVGDHLMQWRVRELALGGSQ